MSGLSRFLLGLSGLLFLLTMLSAPVSAAQRHVFEKGDVLLSDMGSRWGLWPYPHMLPFPIWFMGHAGVYIDWDVLDILGPGGPLNPDDVTVKEHHDKHDVLAYMYQHDNVASLTWGPTQQKFNDFFDCGDFWGVWTPKEPKLLTHAQRRKIVATAQEYLNKDGWYALFWNWYNPDKWHWYKPWKWPGHSFRCDGVVEYCYHEAGSPIIDRTNPFAWFTRWPRMFKTCGVLRERPKAGISYEGGTGEVKEVRLLPSEEGTLKAYACDGFHGSGITMVEFWDGVPDDSPLGGGDEDTSGIRLGYDTHNVIYTDSWAKHNYTLAFDRAYLTDQLYVKAFDQAGNTKVATQHHPRMTWHISTGYQQGGWGPPPEPPMSHTEMHGTVSLKFTGGPEVGSWIGDWNDTCAEARRWAWIYEVRAIPDNPALPIQVSEYHNGDEEVRIYLSAWADCGQRVSVCNYVADGDVWYNICDLPVGTTMHGWGVGSN